MATIAELVPRPSKTFVAMVALSVAIHTLFLYGIRVEPEPTPTSAMTVLNATIATPRRVDAAPRPAVESTPPPVTKKSTPIPATNKIRKPKSISKPPPLREQVSERVPEATTLPPAPEKAPSPVPVGNPAPPPVAENTPAPPMPSVHERSGAKVKAPEPIENPTRPADDVAIIVPTRPSETPVEQVAATPMPDIATAPHPLEPIAQDGPPRSEKPARSALAQPETTTPAPSKPVERAAPAAPKAETTPPIAPQAALNNKEGLPLPAAGEAHYKLRMGIVSGELTLSWKFGEGRYRLDSFAQGSGLFAIAGSYVQISEGEVAADGLRPAMYSRERRNKKDTAEFNWAENSVRFTDKGGSHSEALPAGAQDLLSLLFQLAFVPPQADKLSVIVSNGRKLETYAFERAGDEVLDLQGGKFHTIKIVKARSGDDDAMEVWLALEHHYLPVKIRVTDKKGSVIEQTLTAMKIVDAN